MSANEELDQLKSLLEKGILTQEEFEAKKKLLEDQKGTEPESSSISENISDAVSSNDS